LSAITFVWGVFASAFAAVTSTTSFLVMRFLLGVAEAGTFPGKVLRRRFQMT